MLSLKAKIEDFILLLFFIFIFVFPIISEYLSPEKENIYLCQKVCDEKLFQYKEKSGGLVCFCDKGIPGDYKKVVLKKQ